MKTVEQKQKQFNEMLDVACLAADEKGVLKVVNAYGTERSGRVYRRPSVDGGFTSLVFWANPPHARVIQGLDVERMYVNDVLLFGEEK